MKVEELRKQVKVKSDSEFDKFQKEMAPLIKRNLVAKRRSAFNIAHIEGGKDDADIVL